MKNTALRAGLVVVTSVVLSTSPHAQAKHVPTIEESLSLRSIDSPKISPDGRLVVYSVRETNWKDNEYVNQLWRMQEVRRQRRMVARRSLDCLHD
jgi:hypothetical protein